MNALTPIAAHTPVVSLAAIEYADAELIELGRRIDALDIQISENCRQDAELIPIRDAFFDDVPESLLVTNDDRYWWRGTGGEPLRAGDTWNYYQAEKLEVPRGAVYSGSLKRITARVAELRRAAKEHLLRYKSFVIEIGAKAIEDEYGALCERRDLLVQQAMSIVPHTVNGLVVQAKIVRAESLLWNKDQANLDTGEWETMSFVSNVLAFAAMQED
ncbi:hypothetical protein AB4037_08685 [Labrys sp. KB_33_2]|uniref:hypothetical protein n=1 Tax=Labrys sp. KB_33_2 TaxID=3237479 RepID=UPI003F90FBD4